MSGPAAPPRPVLPLGASVGGRFQIRRGLADGAMARVYVGRDEAADRDVALKVLPPTDDLVMLERMKREATALQTLDHPNIVKTFAHGPTDDGGWFIAMELVEGPPIATWVQQKDPLPAQITQLLLQVCSALRHAHRKGIVHRDLKSSNLLVAREGSQWRVKLIDFGIVQMEGHDTLSGKREVLGSVHTIAPEQIRGDEVDHRADIYAIGVLAFRLYSGKYPYHSKVAAEVMARHLHAPVPVLDASLGLPPGLPEIVARCMAKDPDHRFADVQQLMDALSVCLDVPTSFFVKPVELAEPAPAAAREPLPVALWAVAGAVLVAAGLVSWWLV